MQADMDSLLHALAIGTNDNSRVNRSSFIAHY
jgi:hypothetical protein